MNNKEIIEKICPSSINENGEVKSLEKQLLEFEYETRRIRPCQKIRVVSMKKGNYMEFSITILIKN